MVLLITTLSVAIATTTTKFLAQSFVLFACQIKLIGQNRIFLKELKVNSKSEGIVRKIIKDKK